MVGPVEIAGAIVVVLVVAVILIYNSLITFRNRFQNAWAQIDVQLKRRADLIPNLVESVKGYMKHERGVLESVTQARTAIMSAKTPREAAKAENMMAGALKSLFAVAEDYPKLQASQNFLQLQEELSGTESKIAFARQLYNDTVLEFNQTIQTVPSNIIAGTFGFREQEYFKVEETDKKAVKVKF